MTQTDDTLDPAGVLETYRRAKDRRSTWEQHWRECYDYALPLRARHHQPGAKTADKLFDGTAPDAVDQLAASLLAHLTPPWSAWVGLQPGADVSEADAKRISPKLEKMASVLQTHFDRSNFTVEFHQCLLDLVTAGTACLMLEEAPPGASSAFRFTAVPVFDVVFQDAAQGRLDGTLRRLELTPRELRERYPDAPALVEPTGDGPGGREPRIGVVEAVVPDGSGYRYIAVAEAEPGLVSEAMVLSKGRFETSPFINFRWLKAPGETYGRSPVMKALPDIKTANKVVELTLKDASISVTGIWMADDDGVLNPANIKLVPGAIIPKAVGSKGLQRLESPGQINVSNIVLNDLRGRIRQALMTEKLGAVGQQSMSATEVLERSMDVGRILGATYGRLQSELLNPLTDRALAILRRRGEVPPVRIDGRRIDIDYRSPLARRQSHEDVQGAMTFFTALRELGIDVTHVIDGPRAARWLARAYGLPQDLLRSDTDVQGALDATTGTGQGQGPSPLADDPLSAAAPSHTTNEAEESHG